VDADGRLHTAGSSNDQMRQLELFEIQQQQGPCPEAVRDREVVIAKDLEASRERWPLFASEALNSGFRSAHAIPMRLRDDTVGAINLLTPTPDAMTSEDLGVAQA